MVFSRPRTCPISYAKPWPTSFRPHTRPTTSLTLFTSADPESPSMSKNTTSPPPASGSGFGSMRMRLSATCVVARIAAIVPPVSFVVRPRLATLYLVPVTSGCVSGWTPATRPMSSIFACHFWPGDSLTSASSRSSDMPPPAHTPMTSLQHRLLTSLPSGCPILLAFFVTLGTSGGCTTCMFVRA